jgi:hypothetical protein
MKPTTERKLWKFNYYFSKVYSVLGWGGLIASPFLALLTTTPIGLVWTAAFAASSWLNVLTGRWTRKDAKKAIPLLDERIAREQPQERSDNERSVGRDRADDRTNSGKEVDVADGRSTGTRRRTDQVPRNADPSSPNTEQTNGRPEDPQVVSDDTARPLPPPLTGNPPLAPSGAASSRTATDRTGSLV